MTHRSMLPTTEACTEIRKLNYNKPAHAFRLGLRAGAARNSNKRTMLSSARCFYPAFVWSRTLSMMRLHRCCECNNQVHILVFRKENTQVFQRIRATQKVNISHLINSRTRAWHQSQRVKSGVPKLSPPMYPFSISINEHVPLNMSARRIFSREGPIVRFPGVGQNIFAGGSKCGKI